MWLEGKTESIRQFLVGLDRHCCFCSKYTRSHDSFTSSTQGAEGEVDWVRDKKGTRAQLPVHCLSYMRDARNFASTEAHRGGN